MDMFDPLVHPEVPSEKDDGADWEGFPTVTGWNRMLQTGLLSSIGPCPALLTSLVLEFSKMVVACETLEAMASGSLKTCRLVFLSILSVIWVKERMNPSATVVYK